ncbi:hypothetical protein HPP92_002428 [Vanilla planifolia]|uniref:Uncharacterized protein n=1 Tax=Vanilla planifolia TaxID=51239 RepID=A0A835VGA3_VANPL|nr:hypothetical protein HPP92_002428 [Vanilla planifolia]
MKRQSRRLSAERAALLVVLAVVCALFTSARELVAAHEAPRADEVFHEQSVDGVSEVADVNNHHSLPGSSFDDGGDLQN